MFQNKKLTNFISIYIPNMNNKGHEINNISYIQDIIELFTYTFGGSQFVDIDSTYLNKDNKIICESSKKIHSLFNDKLSKIFEIKLNVILENYKISTHQECVLIELFQDGKFYTIFK